MTWHTGIGLNDGDEGRKTRRLETANVHGLEGQNSSTEERESIQGLCFKNQYLEI